MLRVNNFAATAADNYEVEITYSAPLPFKPAQVESYTLTCEVGGRVFDTQQVEIDRGQVKQLDLSACARDVAPRRRCNVPASRRRSWHSRCRHAQGTPQRDVIVGLGGNDVIRGSSGPDLLCGRAGRDRLLGGTGRDVMRGNRGPDRLLGGAGRDALGGNRGPDRVVGGRAADLLRGGPARDLQRQ